MKPGTKPNFAKAVKSPPAWGRGLKRLCLADQATPLQVAPRVGAWIETIDSRMVR